MYNKKIHVALIAFTIFFSIVSAKKTRKTQRPSYENEESTPQPKVISYSTFGFNDVGSYNGFVPGLTNSATNYINGVNSESTTRLYAAAFPTALETISYGNNDYEAQQNFHEQTYNLDENYEQQPSVLQYPQNIKHFLNTVNQEDDNVITYNQAFTGNNDSDINYPAYGTKLSYRDKNRSNQFNNTEINTSYNSGYLNSNEHKYFNLPETQPTYDIKYGESGLKYENVHNPFVTYPPTGIENFVKPVAGSTQNLLNYPKGVDFTKITQLNYPPATDNFITTTFSTILNENVNSNSYIDHYNKPSKQLSPTVNIYDSEKSEDLVKKKTHKLSIYDDQGFPYVYPASQKRNVSTEVTPNSEYKKKSRNKYRILNKNHTHYFRNWRDSTPLKENEYSANDYNKSINIGSEENEDPTKNSFDEVPESSNVIDFTKYQFSDADFTNFKRMPEFPYDNDYNSIKSTKSKINDYINPYKDLTDTPSTATSYWGNVFKSNNYWSSPTPLYEPPYDDEENDDDIVSITKRPNKHAINRPNEIKSTSWIHLNHRPYNSNESPKDWSNDLQTRYKSEEDLLSIRNHDTSHPSYLPIQKPFYNSVSDNEYKNILEKWKQSYLKAKYKNSLLRDYEAIGTEVEPLHVPIPKPYPIEIPHPVIVPVPKPYPVRIPIAKPVAVPVLRELIVPIEKPVPYPVYKKVPYPIKKRVPVIVEKEVTVSVAKPYPVHVPYVRPVFHHTKSVNEEFENDEEDDYMPRPERSKKNIHYQRRPHSSHNRIRRPSRGGYQERNKRYSPIRRRPSMSTAHNRYRKPYEDDTYAMPNKYHERDNDRLKDDSGAFMLHCKRRGTC